MSKQDDSKETLLKKFWRPKKRNSKKNLEESDLLS
nr:MAG TPA: hypothetical protein [Caudoviricetes sp.]